MGIFGKTMIPGEGKVINPGDRKSLIHRGWRRAMILQWIQVGRVTAEGLVRGLAGDSP